MAANSRKIPAPEFNTETEAYWNAAAEGKLLIRKCLSCGRLHYYPRSICPHCFSDTLTWQEASGRGTIYSYSVMRRAPVPYVMAYVTLDEGVTLLTNIVGCDFDAIRIGQAVKVVFEPAEGNMKVPMYTPA